MPHGWKAKQFGDEVDRFKRKCPKDPWDDLLAAYGILRTRGPQSGNAVAKKLVNGNGIWELVGRAGNLQPRLLFYFDDVDQYLVVFVFAFMKTGGAKDYRRAIETALARRARIKRGEKIANVISAFDSTTRH
jgi:hypothetical protein